MELLRELVRNVALIILIASFIDLFLPGKNMERYLKLIIGLFVVVSVLNPIMAFLGKSQAVEITAWQYQPADERELESIFRQGEEIAKVTRDAAWEEYKKRVERQIVSLVKLVPRVKEVQVDVRFENRDKAYYGSIRRVVMVAAVEAKETAGVSNKNTGMQIAPVENVEIGSRAGPGEPEDSRQELLTMDERKAIETRIKEVVCDFYGLQPSQVTVTAVAQEVNGR